MSSAPAVNLRLSLVALALASVGALVWLYARSGGCPTERSPSAAHRAAEAPTGAPLAATDQTGSNVSETWNAEVAALDEGLPEGMPVFAGRGVPESLTTPGDALAVLATFEALPAARQTELRAAAAFLMNNCPYNRATAQLVATLAHDFDVRPLLGTTFPELADGRERLLAVRAGIAAQWRVMRALDVDALRPADPTGFLASVPIETHALSLAELRATEDRVRASMTALYGANDVVASLDDDTISAISLNVETLVVGIEESWPLKHWLSLHANDLRATLAEANAVLTSCAAADCDPSLESAARAMAGFAGRFHEAIVAQLSVRC